MQSNTKSTEASTIGQCNEGTNTGQSDYFPGLAEVDVEKLFGGVGFLPDLGSPRFDVLSIPVHTSLKNHPGSVTRPGHSNSSPASVRKPASSARNDLQQLFAFIMAMDQRLTNLEHFVTSSLDGGYQSLQMAPIAAPPVRHSDSNYIPSMRDLDQVCNAEFAKEHTPNNSDLNRIYQVLQGQYPAAGRRNIFSAVRKWYRKKRDENGQRVFTTCIAVIQPLINEGVSVETIKESLRNENDSLYKRIYSETNLDVKDPERARKFLLDKIDSYFKRRVLDQ